MRVSLETSSRHQTQAEHKGTWTRQTLPGMNDVKECRQQVYHDQVKVTSEGIIWQLTVYELDDEEWSWNSREQ